MKRVLFCVIPERGHINPYIGPAQQLQAHGIEVAFHAEADITEQLDRAGPFVFLGSQDRPQPPDRRIGAAFAAQVRNPVWLRDWITTLLLDRVPEQVTALRGVIRHWQPDVVVIDPLVYAAAIAAEQEARPWASVSNSLNPVLPDTLDSELLATVRGLSPQRQALFARYGMAADFRGCDVLSPHLTLAFTTEAFIGGRVPGVHLVGPSRLLHRRGDETEFPYGWIDPSRPLVYMSLGSQIYYQPTMFRRMVEVAEGRAIQLVLSASELVGSAELPPLPDNVLAARYAPQLGLLQRAAVFVTHGGANSVMEALDAGVPMLVSPLCNDQFHQAHFVTRAGVGLQLDLSDASAAEVDAALTALIEAGSLRDRAAAIAASYRRDGAAEAAALISALA